MSEGPVFVVGTMRSGSTLFRLILDAHPRISISEETGFMGGLAAAKQIPNWARGRGWYERIGFSEQEFDARLREFYAGMFERHARSQGKQRWGEKTPFHSRHIAQMATVFPDSVFVGDRPASRRGRALARGRSSTTTWPTPSAYWREHQHGDPAPRARARRRPLRPAPLRGPRRASEGDPAPNWSSSSTSPGRTTCCATTTCRPPAALLGSPAGQHPDARPDQHRPRPPVGRRARRRGAADCSTSSAAPAGPVLRLRARHRPARRGRSSRPTTPPGTVGC